MSVTCALTPCTPALLVVPHTPLCFCMVFLSPCAKLVWHDRSHLQEEASIQHDWIVHLHDRYFSKKSAKGPASLQLAHSLKETLWASAMVRTVQLTVAYT